MTEWQGNKIIALLEGITLRLDAYAEMMAPDESDECQHPDEQRISLTSIGDLNHWVCSVCRFDNKAPMES